MAEKLIIRLRESDAADWVRLSQAGQILEGASNVPPEDLKDLPDTGAVCLMVPGERCLLTRVALPVRQRGRMLRALPFALEDQLAANVEDLHFAAGQWREGEVPVAVVSHADMRHWLERMEQAGLRPQRIVPEPLALPWDEDSVSILLEPGRALLRWSADEGGAFDLGSLDLVLRRIAGDRAIHVWRTADAPKPRSGQGKRVELIEQPASWLATTLGSGSSVNLLSAPYASHSDSSGLRRRLRLAAALAGTWLVAQFVYAGIDYYSLKSRADQLYNQQFEIFENAFPGEPAQDPPKQMRQQVEAMQVLRGMGAQSGALALLGGTGQSLQASRQVTLESLNYRDGVLEFSLRSPDMAQLEALRQRIERASDLRAELTGNTMTAQGISGRLQVSRGDSG